jgi:hypothetical protein
LIRLLTFATDMELQKRIQEFIAERRAQAAAAKAATVTQSDAPMDVDDS